MRERQRRSGRPQPDVVAGPQIQVVYAHPADAPDRFASLASPIASDVAALGAWWRGQDASREPLRPLPVPGLRAGTGRARPPRRHAARARLVLRAPSDGVHGHRELAAFRARRKYLVYWDAPVSDTGTCGQGSGDYAFVYVHSCSTNVGDGGFSAAVAGHELLHALGAVPSGAKHECAAPDAEHVCDSQYDVMYPYIAGPIEGLSLDVGRDDYYGIGHVSTFGAGRVVSDAGGIDCPGACATSQEPGVLVMLTAKPQKGSTFAGWSGACRGRGKCYVTVGKRSAVRARFVSARTSPRG